MRRSHNNHHGGAWPRRRRAVTLTRTAHWHPRSEPDWFDPLRCTPTRPSSSRTSATSTTSSSSTRPTPSDLRRPSSLRGSIRRCAARCDRAQSCATRRADTTTIVDTTASRSVSNPHRRTTAKNTLGPSRTPCAGPPTTLRQGECVWLHLDLIGDVLSHCKEVFPSVDYCYTTIPTYPSGQATPCCCCLGPRAPRSFERRHAARTYPHPHTRAGQIGFLVCSTSPNATLREPRRRPPPPLQQQLRYYSPAVRIRNRPLPRHPAAPLPRTHYS